MTNVFLKVYQRGSPRCDTIGNLQESGCSRENINSPSTVSEILEVKDLELFLFFVFYISIVFFKAHK